jgi:hypothetical protein
VACSSSTAFIASSSCSAESDLHRELLLCTSERQFELEQFTSWLISFLIGGRMICMLPGMSQGSPMTTPLTGDNSRHELLISAVTLWPTMMCHMTHRSCHAVHTAAAQVAWLSQLPSAQLTGCCCAVKLARLPCTMPRCCRCCQWMLWRRLQLVHILPQLQQVCGALSSLSVTWAPV